MFRTLRRTPVIAIVVALLSALLAFTATTGSADATRSRPASTDAKITPGLRGQLAASKSGPFWVRFAADASLSRAARLENWNARGRAVVDQLTATANSSQRSVVATLTQQHVQYTSFWVTNSIYIDDGSAALASQLASSPDVEKIEATTTVPVEKPVPGRRQPSVDSVEWGVDNIGADRVWSDFGDTGQNIVVASIDTGVQFDHPALVNQYRGNDGGAFDNNYNWYDPSGVCPDAEPCDNVGHGTHTMGTMVGDDGAGNQIGVAPGARWMAAKGCESDSCTELALTESAQWIVAPTDLNNENPDPSMRPNIVNNSWGGVPDDPWYSDFVDAWVAAGIFPQFSNGNSGPDCDSAGAPGEYPQSYSAGMYDVDNVIDPGSSRGPGVGGDIKPNISAPGVDVRSSVPGDGYDTYTGTSMASPHVAGTVALIWSAAPSLIGDIAATRALLDDAAIDTPDDSCGGTADDNNVYGEGRLDAFDAVSNAPIGAAGTITGTVTDSDTGEPLDDATVALSSTPARSTTTDADGSYAINVAAGTYDLTVTKFGYHDASVTGVVVAGGVTVTRDLALDPLPSATLSGLVRDGSGHGWPLYAKVTAVGVPDGVTYTRPGTGRFSLVLPVGGPYTVQIEAVQPGYRAVTRTWTLPRDTAHDVSLHVGPDCTAPGYAAHYSTPLQTFNASTTPPGWTVVDNQGSGETWTFNDPGERGNLTGGSGNFAVVDSDAYGPDGVQDTSLVSPRYNLSGVTTPIIEFKTDFNQLGSEAADVDLSVNGGSTWSNVWTRDFDIRGPRTVRIPIPAAAGAANVKVRFHYGVAEWAWWWEVDDVTVGSRVCATVPGGLVYGYTTDANTGLAVNGVTVTSNAAPAVTGTSMATPDDPGIKDGFYWLFSPGSGQRSFTATKTSYAATTTTVSVAADWVTRADFALTAGQLAVSPAQLNASTELGTVTSGRFTVTNDGTAPATVDLGERDKGFVILRADGSTATARQLARMPGAPLRHTSTQVSPLRSGAARAGAGPRSGSPGPHDAPWVDLTDYPSNIMDNAAGDLGGLIYSFGGTADGDSTTGDSFVYDPAALAWTPIAPMPEGRQKPSGAFVDGKFYVIGGWTADGGTSAATEIYDPGSDSWSEGADNPTPWAAAGTAVLDGQIYSVGGCGDGCGVTDVTRYDPVSDTFDVLADYPESTSWLACAGIGGKVYCGGGNDGGDGDGGLDSTYVYDPGSDSWSPVASMPSTVWGAASVGANDLLLVSGGIVDGDLSNEGFAYDPAADQWTALPNSNDTVYRGAGACGFTKVGGSTGSFDASPLVEQLPGYETCGVAPDLPWISENPTSLSLDPGESVSVRVVMNAHKVSQPGAYSAALVFAEDTPYDVAPLPVTLHVTPPPSWGKIKGTVQGRSCAGEVAPIAGATVQIDSELAHWTLATDTAGAYSRWIPHAYNPLHVIIAKDGYRPVVKDAIIKAGHTVTVGAVLAKTGC